MLDVSRLMRIIPARDKPTKDTAKENHSTQGGQLAIFRCTLLRMKYLIYDSPSDAIYVGDEQPTNFMGHTHPDILAGQVSVWHEVTVPTTIVDAAVQVFILRMSKYPFAEINSAVNQIVAQYNPRDYSFLAIGASPKVIKWILKKKGYNTVAISVSKVTSANESTPEFKEYVQRKLAKATASNLVLLDFVESGDSLVQMKNYISKLWTRGTVSAAAIGVGAKYKPGTPTTNQIDFIVQNIPELTRHFEGNVFKQRLGRNKLPKDYTTYPQPVKDAKVFSKDIKSYAHAKSAFARAAELGPLDFTLSDLMEELIEGESNDSDDASTPAEYIDF
jgi:hypothetical protein